MTKMTPPPQLQLKNQICHSIYSATNALVRAYRPLLDRLDLTYPQYLVMLSLWEKDGVKVKDICDDTRLDAGTLSPLLKRLEAKGLVVRERSTLDERQRVINVTDTGKTLMNEAADIPMAVACQVKMTPEQAMQLKELCELLYQSLEQTS